MKNLGITLAIIVLMGLFLYSLRVVSDTSVCTGVRSFACQKKEKQQHLVLREKIRQEILQEQELSMQEYKKTLMDTSSADYALFKKIGDSFVHLCNPDVTASTGVYLVDYSKCNLLVTVGKDQKAVQQVSVNGTGLTQAQIDENLAKLWFSF